MADFMASAKEHFSVEKLLVGALSPGANVQNSFNSLADESYGWALFWGAMVVLSLIVLGVLINIVAGWANPYLGFRGKSRLINGNFASAGNSPLWYGGSDSDQANLAVSRAYANGALSGSTGWVEPGARGVSCPVGRSADADSEARSGAALQQMSDAGLAALAQ